MNKKIIIYFIMVLLYSFIPVAASQMDIGEDIDFEYRYLKHEGTVIGSEFRQRIKLYVKGYLENNIEIGAQLQSSGVMNSTNTFVVYEGAKIQNVDPFFEQAYIKLNKYYGYPVSISFGKIPLNWVDGVLVNDNQLGLPAIYVEADVPFEIRVEAFHCRTRNDLLDISGIKGYGIRSIREFGFRRVELDYTLEDYKSTARVTRSIYGGNFTRNMHKGLQYNFFGYKMKGKKGDIPFSGYAIGAYGKFEGIIDPIGKGGTWLNYILGSGDENDDESGFLPILSTVESSIIGDYYGRYREFRYVDSVVSKTITMSNSVANLSMFRYAIYATARDDVSVFMIRSTYKKHIPSLPIGGSLTYGIKYHYHQVDFEFRYTTFTPEDLYDYYIGDRPSKIYSVGLDARF